MKAFLADLEEGSKPLLDEVVKVLQEHPEITKVQIEGYTDAKASREHNQRLSEERAATVKGYLVSHGIAAGRLGSKGFGEDKPIGDNATEEGRSANRRVELHILERKP